MNAENFSSFLQDPSKLYQIPYQELKSLVVQYPYCQPLRILLLQKSQMEQHPDFERNLHAAATYLPDRTLLFFLIREFQALDSGELLFELEEERLELKALSEIMTERQDPEPELITVPAEEPKISASAAVLDLFQEEEEENTHEEETSSIFEEEEPETKSDPETPVVFPAEEPMDAIPPEAEPLPVPSPNPAKPVATGKPAPKPVAPQPKSAFSSWDKRYEQLRKLASTLDALPLPPSALHEPLDESGEDKPKKKKTRHPLAKVLAKKSVEKKEGIVTETLAEILARQGHKRKAIAMYEKLSLIFPEKSSFFALKIENLKRN